MMVWSYSIFGADMLAIFGKGAERGRCMCWLLHYVPLLLMFLLHKYVVTQLRVSLLCSQQQSFSMRLT